MSETEAPLDAVVPGRADIDGYGRSALLLVESLIHGLIDRNVISAKDAVEIASSAYEVLCALNDELPAELSSQGYPEQPLLRILASLEIDACA